MMSSERSISSPQSVADHIHDDLGPALRMVAQYDANGIDVLYIRDDVEDRRSEREFADLHRELLRENLSQFQLEAEFHSGPLRSSMLAFEEFVAFNFIADEREGYVVTVEPDVEVDLRGFFRKYETVVPAQKRFEVFEFVHERGEPCPRCGSHRTISTPEAGDSGAYYCMDCDHPYD